jgi:hypothetical protein
MPRRVFAAALAWLCLTLCTKAVRYARPEEPRQARTERAVGSFMAAHGLVAAGSRPITADGGYTATSWRTPGCTGTVTVAALGTGDDFLEAVKAALGGDVAYLQSGALSPRPRQTALALRIMASSAAGWIGARDSTPSILAISPPPRDDGDRCSGPTPAEWGRFKLSAG